MNSNKKKAVLLWSLLPVKQKIAVQKFLTLEEVQFLREALKNYQKLEKQERFKIEKQLYYIFTFPLERIVYFIFFTFVLLFLLLFFYYLFRHTHVSSLYLFTLFWPLALGTFSFLLLLTFSSFEFYVLFSFSKNKFHYLFTLLIYYILLYLLYKINQMEYNFVPDLQGEEYFIMLLGITIAPLTEEIIFRHYTPNVFSKSLFYNITGHVISNIIFSILHIPAYLEQGILYFMCGMFLSMLKLYTDKLIFPVLAHSMSNITIFYLY